jgi:hypothetical protein
MIIAVLSAASRATSVSTLAHVSLVTHDRRVLPSVASMKARRPTPRLFAVVIEYGDRVDAQCLNIPSHNRPHENRAVWIR